MKKIIFIYILSMLLITGCSNTEKLTKEEGLKKVDECINENKVVFFQISDKGMSLVCGEDTLFDNVSKVMLKNNIPLKDNVNCSEYETTIWLISKKLGTGNFCTNNQKVLDTLDSIY